MKRTSLWLGAIALIASAHGFAQSNSSTGGTAHQGSGNPQPGNATHSMDKAAGAGGADAASGTLMQQREKGMSPQGASGSTSTGQMKQQ